MDPGDSENVYGNPRLSRPNHTLKFLTQPCTFNVKLRRDWNSLSLWTALIGPFMILSWQLDGAGWLISIISLMILILAARWLSLHAVFLPEFCPHSALIWQLTLAPKTSTKDIAIRNRVKIVFLESGNVMYQCPILGFLGQHQSLS